MQNSDEQAKKLNCLQFYIPFKIISLKETNQTLSLRLINQSVGGAKTGVCKEKPFATSTKRTWLVKYATWGLNPLWNYRLIKTTWTCSDCEADPRFCFHILCKSLVFWYWQLISHLAVYFYVCGFQGYHIWMLLVQFWLPNGHLLGKSCSLSL